MFFFSKEVKEGALDAVPAGYDVVEMKTGLPVLKKKVVEAPASEAAPMENAGLLSIICSTQPIVLLDKKGD